MLRSSKEQSHIHLGQGNQLSPFSRDILYNEHNWFVPCSTLNVPYSDHDLQCNFLTNRWRSYKYQI